MEPEDPTGHTLSYLHWHMRTQFDTGVQCVKKYIERNALPELEKAFAFQVFSTAMTQWGQSVSEAAHTAADVTGFNHEVIRRWASFFFCVAALNQPSDEIEEEVIAIELASQRGRCIDPTSLVNSEDFKINARKFVRQNAYKKGEPNMTVNVFRMWVETAYNVKIVNETARLLLHRLGFSQKHHQKGVYFDGHERSDVVGIAISLCQCCKTWMTQQFRQTGSFLQ